MGLAIVAIGVVSYWQDKASVAALPARAEDASAYADSFYIVSSPLGVLVFNTTMGLITMGLGAVLFYLRRLYLVRRQV